MRVILLFTLTVLAMAQIRPEPIVRTVTKEVVVPKEVVKEIEVVKPVVRVVEKPIIREVIKRVRNISVL